MKKILLVGWIVLLSNSLFGNPIPRPPAAIISEFMFTPDNKWELEIDFEMNGYVDSLFDSIWIATSSGASRIRMDFIKDGTILLVITPDSLDTPLLINRTGDSISLYSAWHVGGLMGLHRIDNHKVTFGNYPGSMCDSIPAGYSICSFDTYNGEVCCLCKYPTIGAANDTTGCCVTLAGNMYDAKGKRITNGNFALDYSVTFNPDGTFVTRILARKFRLGGMTDFSLPREMQLQDIEPLNIEAYPDSVIRADVQFAGLVGVKEKPVPSTSDLYIINYPNPFNPATNFYVRIPDNLKRKEGRIDIYNSIGQKVFVVRLSNTSSYKWKGIDMSGKAVASGVYYYRLVFDNAVYKNSSMILLK